MIEIIIELFFIKLAKDWVIRDTTTVSSQFLMYTIKATDMLNLSALALFLGAFLSWLNIFFKEVISVSLIE